MRNKGQAMLAFLIVVGVLGALMLGCLFEQWRWRCYKELTHSDISFFSYLMFADKIKIIGVAQ